MPFDITEKAMLASLHIRQWAARKHDKAVSREVNTHYGSQADAGRFNKVLATKEALKEIQTVVSAARGFHLEQTLPWGERGERLLPVRPAWAAPRHCPWPLPIAPRSRHAMPREGRR